MESATQTTRPLRIGSVTQAMQDRIDETNNLGHNEAIPDDLRLSDDYDQLNQAAGIGVDEGPDLNTLYDDLIQRQSGIAIERMEGNVPQDVLDTIQQAVAESSLMNVGAGQGALYMTARDIGRTSFDIQSQGMEDAGNVETMINASMALREEFHVNRTRLEQTWRTIDLSQQQINESIRQFNQSQIMAAEGQISSLTLSGLQLQPSFQDVGLDFTNAGQAIRDAQTPWQNYIDEAGGL